jgi:hypothetical protein
MTPYREPSALKSRVSSTSCAIARSSPERHLSFIDSTRMDSSWHARETFTVPQHRYRLTDEVAAGIFRHLILASDIGTCIWTTKKLGINRNTTVYSHFSSMVSTANTSTRDSCCTPYMESDLLTHACYEDPSSILGAATILFAFIRTSRCLLPARLPGNK